MNPIPYKKHIRKIVEASTIHETNRYKEMNKVAKKIILENPMYKAVLPWFIKIPMFVFLASVIGLLYYVLFIVVAPAWRN